MASDYFHDDEPTVRGFLSPKLVPWVLLSLSGMVLVALGLKYRTLRQDFLEHRRADTRLQPGTYVPSFTAVSATGDSLMAGYASAGERQLLILLTSTCPFCRETLPEWKGLVGRLADSSLADHDLRVLGLTTDSLSDAAAYAKANDLPFPLVPFPNRKLASLYRGFTVPQIIVSDAEGRVVFARHGVIRTTQAVDSILAALVVSAPPRNTASGPGVAVSRAQQAPAGAAAGGVQ